MTAGGKLFSRGAAIVVTAVAVIAMVRFSAVPVSVQGANASRLRLSWSARPERIEKCRTRSDEELAKLEPHMRQRIECDGRFASYNLSVRIGGRTVHESIVRGAGLRNDRPIYLLEDLPAEPGERHVRITFQRREKNDDEESDDHHRDDSGHDEDRDKAAGDTGIFAGRDVRERVERERRKRAAIPPKLEIDTTLRFVPGRVIIVTLDSDRGALQVLGSTHATGR